ncbi:hypothetical protein [Shouchella patagoniensis]|uniref:hypothetical protein n=1 Tax=Shouchella patagoniensis TaxID=228576 RepID=UPI00099531C9|nr:hypothetical protein [Shouchella patagoniensis]
MKKNHLLLSLGLVSVITLTACGEGADTDASVNESNDPQTEETASNENNTNEEQEEETDSDWETQVGESVETEGGLFTLIARQDQIETVETGPMTLDIPQLNVQDVKLSEDLIEFVGFEPTGIIQIDMEVSNTSDDDINFYASQATITTNTGEQLESDMWFSDHIDGEFLGQVNKSGSIYYFLTDSDLEEVESIRIMISAPNTIEDWEDVGEEVDFEVNVK